jgi:hypothetical protein
VKKDAQFGAAGAECRIRGSAVHLAQRFTLRWEWRLIMVWLNRFGMALCA